jgi:chemotaxis protein MotA
MDLATVIGLCLAIVLILFAIVLGPQPLGFLDANSILIVIGGTLGVTLVKFRLAKVFQSIIKGVQSALFEKSETPNELIALTDEIAHVVRKDGLLALEDYPIQNQFYKKGVGLLVDGHDPNFIRTVLSNEMRLDIEESEQSEIVMRAIADSAPGMGMIGTLIGLVQMLANMSDPSMIGPAMAVALLTTLYGAFIAQVIALPLADKLSLRSKRDKEMMSLVIDSVISIQKGLSPRVIGELLKTYVPKDEREGEEEAS